MKQIHSSHQHSARSVYRLWADSQMVIGQRVGRFTAPENWLEQQTHVEAVRMVWEKQLAFWESYVAFSKTATTFYQRALPSMWQGKMPALPRAGQWLGLMNSGLKPYQKRVASNKRRLRRN